MNKVKKSYADMDPLEEIRAIREELNREFPTVEAFGDYLRAKYPDTDPTLDPQQKNRRVSVKPKPTANTRPAMRQRKSAVHA